MVIAMSDLVVGMLDQVILVVDLVADGRSRIERVNSPSNRLRRREIGRNRS